MKILDIFDNVKYITEGKNIFGSVLIFILLAIYLFTSYLRRQTLEGQVITGLILYMFKGTILAALIIAVFMFFFFGFDKWDVSHTRSDLYKSSKIDTVRITPTPRTINIIEYVKTLTPVEGGDHAKVKLKQNDTLYLLSQKFGYNVNVSLKENQRYDDLRAPLQIKISSINLQTRSVDFSINNTSNDANNATLFFKQSEKGFFYVYQYNRYYLNFTNIRAINGIKFADLNIIKL